MRAARRLPATLPQNHKIGLVIVSLGFDYHCDACSCFSYFLKFVRKQSRSEHFSFSTMHGTRTCKEMFDGFFEALGDVETQGTA